MSIISLLSPEPEKQKTLQLVDIIQNDIPFQVAADTADAKTADITLIGVLMVLIEAAITITTSLPIQNLLARIAYNDANRSAESARVLKTGYSKSFRGLGFDLQFLNRFPFPRGAVTPRLSFSIANGAEVVVDAVGKYSIEVWDFV